MTGETLRYDEFAPRVLAAAARLGEVTSGSFGAGSSLMIVAPNCVDYVVSFHAALVRGGVVTTANPAYTAAELAHQLRDSKATHVVTTRAVEPKVFEALAIAGRSATVSVLGHADAITAVASPATTADSSSSALLSLEGRPATCACPATLDLAAGPFDAATSLAAVPYSSGTTGLAKGVLLTHRNLIALVAFSEVFFKRHHPEVLGATTLGLLPFFHIYGMMVVLHNSLFLGSRVVTLPSFDPGTFVATIEEHRVAFAHLVPPLVLFLQNTHPKDSRPLDSLRVIMSGAAPLDASTQRDVAARLRCKVIQGYGLTETAPSILLDPAQNFGTSGALYPMVEARLVPAPDEGEDQHPAGASSSWKEEGPRRGELWARSPQVMAGYLGRPEATAAARTADGWFRTGDVAKIDARGNFTIVDRLKELIKVKGLQVAPAELEGLLLTHPAVADAAVVGRPDSRAGERPHAFVVLQAASASDDTSPEKVAAFLDAKVAPHKRLGGVTFVDVIPKSASGKILRRVLKLRLTGES